MEACGVPAMPGVTPVERAAGTFVAGLFPAVPEFSCIVPVSAFGTPAETGVFAECMTGSACAAGRYSCCAGAAVAAF